MQRQRLFVGKEGSRGLTWDEQHAPPFGDIGLQVFRTPLALKPQVLSSITPSLARKGKDSRIACVGFGDTAFEAPGHAVLRPTSARSTARLVAWRCIVQRVARRDGYT